MTIGEKASAYAGYYIPHSRDMVTRVKMNCKYNDFKAGAEWMLDKVMDLLKDCEVFDRLGGRPVKAEDFRKALEK